MVRMVVTVMITKLKRPHNLELRYVPCLQYLRRGGTCSVWAVQHKIRCLTSAVVNHVLNGFFDLTLIVNNVLSAMWYCSWWVSPDAESFWNPNDRGGDEGLRDRKSYLFKVTWHGTTAVHHEQRNHSWCSCLTSHFVGRYLYGYVYIVFRCLETHDCCLNVWLVCDRVSRQIDYPCDLDTWSFVCVLVNVCIVIIPVMMVAGALLFKFCCFSWSSSGIFQPMF